MIRKIFWIAVLAATITLISNASFLFGAFVVLHGMKLRMAGGYPHVFHLEQCLEDVSTTDRIIMFLNGHALALADMIDQFYTLAVFVIGPWIGF